MLVQLLKGQRYLDLIHYLWGVLHLIVFSPFPSSTSAAPLPEGCSASLLQTDILPRHAPILDRFEAGIGLSLARPKSEILAAILARRASTDDGCPTSKATIVQTFSKRT